MTKKGMITIDNYKIVYCRNCKHSVFPFETAPWGTCCKTRTTICKTVRRTCNTFEWKEVKHGKDK